MKYFIIILAITLLACKKEQPNHSVTIYNPDCDVVFDNTQSGQTGNLHFYQDSIQYKLPMFNPNNSNEIVYQSLKAQ
jgi:hypothetical protein